MPCARRFCLWRLCSETFTIAKSYRLSRRESFTDACSDGLAWCDGFTCSKSVAIGFADTDAYSRSGRAGGLRRT
jgi:hypothetical protein